MSITRLQEDLLNDFKEQKKIVIEQTELFDPLALALCKPAARRLSNPILLIILETVLYLAAGGIMTMTIILNRLYPFAGLKNVRYLRSAGDIGLLTEAEHFSIIVHGMAGCIALLLFGTARMVRRIRQKNKILRLAGNHFRIIAGQHLSRKAAIQSLDERHALDLPSYAGTASIKPVPDTMYFATDFDG